MKLAVLTSGGDSAGMNAVVRAVVKAGILKCVFKLPISVLITEISPGVARLGLFERAMKASSVETQKLIMSRTLFLF